MCINYDLLTYCLYYNIATVAIFIMIRVFLRIFSLSLSIEALVPEICAIFSWQVMKMCHRFLTSGS